MDDKEDVEDIPIEEQVDILMGDLPVPIQRFLKSPERDAVSLNLTRKYGLHTDDAGAFERAYIFMLLGVFTPEEFAQELRDGGLDEATVRGLATDINEGVFKKLRQQEREETIATSAYRTQPPVPAVAPMQVGESQKPVPQSLPGQDSRPEWAAPAPGASASATSTASPAPPSMPSPAAAAAAPTPIYSNAPVAPAIPAQAAPYAPQAEQYPSPQHPRTMAEDMQRVAQGSVSQPPAQASAPQSQPAFAPAAHTPPSAPTEPVHAAYATPLPPSPSAPPVTAPIRLTPVDRARTGAPIQKEFGSDPYREPIE